MDSRLGVLITSHPKQQKFWDYGLGSWEGCPLHIIMGYDDVNGDEVPFDKYMPPVKEVFYTGYPKGYIGHFRGELEQLKTGGLMLERLGYELFYKTAADTTCWKWRNLDKLCKAISNYDFIMCGTAIIFGRVKSFNKCMELWNTKLKCGGAELYFGSQIKAFNMKVRPEKPPWWEEMLGRIHTQGEYAANNQMSVIGTWVEGHKWGEDFKHRDIVKGRY